MQGKEKNLQFMIQIFYGDGMSDSAHPARYRGSNIEIPGRQEISRNGDIMPDWDEEGWSEIEVGWIESAILVFKK